MIWTGLAMSPAVTSVFPFIVTVFGGQQSARTIHFFVDVRTGDLFPGPRRDGLSNGFQEPHEGHDYGRGAEERSRHER